MINVIDRIEPGPVQEWYRNNSDTNSLNRIVSDAEVDGYSLNPKSGLLFRKVYSDQTIERLGYTILDIVFPRPVDLHFHEDVDEALNVLNGEGYFWRVKKLSRAKESVFPGNELYIPKRCVHTFTPVRNGFLEMRLACSGKLDPEKEIQIERFDIYWKDYFNI